MNVKDELDEESKIQLLLVKYSKYCQPDLDEETKIQFLLYLEKTLKRIKPIEIAKCLTKVTYLGDPLVVDSNTYKVEEIFKSEEELAKSGRRSLTEGYEKQNSCFHKDGIICLKSFLDIPTNDTRFEKKQIDNDKVCLIAAYMLYPNVRKYAPKILTECINEDIQEYETKDAFGYFLASYEALTKYRKEYEKILENEKAKEMENNE